MLSTAYFSESFHDGSPKRNPITVRVSTSYYLYCSLDFSLLTNIRSSFKFTNSWRKRQRMFLRRVLEDVERLLKMDIRKIILTEFRILGVFTLSSRKGQNCSDLMYIGIKKFCYLQKYCLIPCMPYSK